MEKLVCHASSWKGIQKSSLGSPYPTALAIPSSKVGAVKLVAFFLLDDTLWLQISLLKGEERAQCTCSLKFKRKALSTLLENTYLFFFLIEHLMGNGK